ncbi:glycerol-3-phosphate 1-O-acyltransferase PlsB [Psychromonas aquatilis]|uniref:Glycerol-3-phosphate acyltransferase n=1 Tax=Psychromonas aquatilis TaxID=2005072 RepID=A0ABU9GM68_9GAMM
MLIKGFWLPRLLNRYWVKSVVVPQHPVRELALDLTRPIIYIVDQNSASDLLALQQACLKRGLPDPYLPIQVQGQSLAAVVYLHDRYFLNKKPLKQVKANYLAQYQQIVTLHLHYPELDMQLVPVTSLWGRNPGKNKLHQQFNQQSNVSFLQKSWSILSAGQDHLLRFNPPISVRRLTKKGSNSSAQAYKLARVALHYFRAQHRSSCGPQIPARKKLIKDVLSSQLMQQVIEEECQKSSKTEQQVREQCEAYLREISSNFSYRFIRVFRTILGRVWNGIYQGIEVNNAQAVRDATQSGAEIIYMPCHRSHMDYLLLSYLLYSQGLTPPHVAAGVNLNFFPAGGIFRRSGAFFLRRTFKDSPLYGSVFKAYFAYLFKKGYPIEFFTEGGRSRTGRLLPAKTGLLSMTLQTFLDQPDRNVVIIPVYIGYDHIMEVSTYVKELSGQKKQQENAWQILGIFKKLQNFGRAFVNFGKPIELQKYMDQQQPVWRDNVLNEQQVTEQVNHLAALAMQGINQATAVNALPLCAAILLANKEHQVDKLSLLTLLELHKNILASHTNKPLFTYPTESAEGIYQQALSMNKFSENNHVVCCDQQQSTHLTYYRNTIVHVFAFESMLSFGLLKLSLQATEVNSSQLVALLQQLFPFVEKEYFLAPTTETMKERINNLLVQFQAQGLLRLENGKIQLLNKAYLLILSEHLKETRLRYYCILSLLIDDFEQSDQDLMAKVQSKLDGQSIEPFDEKVIKVFIHNLHRKKLSFPQAKRLLNDLSMKIEKE